MDDRIKVVGRRRPCNDPADCVERAWRLERELDLLNPFPRPRGFVFKAKTWEEWHAWRAAQSNPRLR